MAEVKQKSRKFVYRTTVSWIEEKRGLLCSSSKPKIEIATPPEFKGHEGIWTPEELFTASVNICIMTTFLYYIEKENIKIKSYESSAEGTVEMTDKGLSFSKIEVSPNVLITKKTEAEKIRRAFELAEERCLISNSITSSIVVTPSIKTEA